MIRYDQLNNQQSTAAMDTSIKKARVLVFGNEKGGCGKSTAAMHTIIGLLRLGFTVGSIDVDSRQATLSRYLKNRFYTNASLKSDLPNPTHISLNKSAHKNPLDARVEEGWFFTEALNELSSCHDFVVIDTPGHDSYVNRLAHSFADTIITPLNDSFIDLDLLADVDPKTLHPSKPSIYSEMIWEQRKNKIARAAQTEKMNASIDWIVMRNRMARQINKIDHRIETVLGKIKNRYGFTLCEGFTERDIFRSMFLDGLTLLDLHDVEGTDLTLDMIRGRQEIRTLLETIGLRRKVISQRTEKLNPSSDPSQKPQAVNAA